MMRLLGTMCFSSSVICLLIVAGHGYALPGHHGLENSDSGTTTSRVNGSQHRHPFQASSDMKNILNSSYTHKSSQKDPSYGAEYNTTYHIFDFPGQISRNLHQLWRKKRTADTNVPPTKPKESHSSQITSKENHEDHSHQPAQQGAPSPDLESGKYQSSHHHDNHSHGHDGHSHGHDGHDSEGSNHHGKVSHNHNNTHELTDQSQHTSHPCHNGKDDHPHPHEHEDNTSPSADFHQHRPKSTRNISGRVWLYATIAVVVISLCGLLSVAVIPIMQKWFYHTLLQFLVGLAVGSLSGDGLLHLMPHAILDGEDSHDHDGHSHSSDFESMEKTAIWRGLAALGGIFLFFIAERLLGALTTYKRQKKEAKLSRHSKNMMPVMQREDGANNGNVGEKLAQPKKNSYDHIREKDEKETIQMLQTEATPSRKGSVQSTHEVGFHGRSSFSLEPDMSVAYRPDSESSVIVSEHHGHGHGHSHDIPQSVSAVAWMVIMGDGLHNFCDGLAIGAAFASGDADGISTTVAVFCHELPHELGDFAMLLKTGMKVKQALFYNGLSSILCFVGMVIGVCLGNVNSATNWVFAGTAGMFLYIALVDMLPELTSGNESGLAAVSTLAVQMVGICIGICVMLLIALYEHKLHSIVS